MLGNRSRGVIHYDDVYLDVFVEGEGQLLVMLPSSGRDSVDYHEAAAGLAERGFRVLRPQPRGMLGSTGRLDRITFHDYARDIAAVIENQGGGPAIVLGHAFGNWIARTVAVDYPRLVKGVILAAAAAKEIPPYLFEISRKAADPNLSNEERLRNLVEGFFVKESDARGWLTGWHLFARRAQSAARQATRREDWWSAGLAPILDLQALADPWRPRETANELRNEFGIRVTIATVADASHALLPEQPAAVVEEIVKWARQL